MVTGSVMPGNAEVRRIEKEPVAGSKPGSVVGMLNWIMSTPGLALASRIAWRKLPAPESAAEVTGVRRGSSSSSRGRKKRDERRRALAGNKRFNHKPNRWGNMHTYFTVPLLAVCRIVIEIRDSTEV